MELFAADWSLARARGHQLLDVRAPIEFAEDHVPGARSLPLFENDQRAFVGTLYRREGPARAFRQARSIIRARIADLLTAVADDPELQRRALEAYDATADHLEEGLDPKTRVRDFDARALAAMRAEGCEPSFVYCWRGGMRSRAFVLFLQALGLPAVQVRGGYKAYRAGVLADLAALEPPPAVVIHGVTGTGKTALLELLAPRFPGAVLDLEGLAGHRSSILGDVGLEPASQKRFDNRVRGWFEDNRAPRIIVEGESRKIGSVIIPPRLWRAMAEGIHLRLDCPAPIRAARLVAEYVRPERAADLRERLVFLAGRLGRKRGAALLAAWDGGEVQAVAEQLLTDYYDPRYQHAARAVTFAAAFDSSELGAAADAISAWLADRPPPGRGS